MMTEKEKIDVFLEKAYSISEAEDKIYELPTDAFLEKAHFILKANDLRSKIYEEEEVDAFELECEMRDVSASMAMDAEAELIKARNEGIEKALDLLYKQNIIDSKIVKTTMEIFQSDTEEDVCEEKDMVECCGCGKKVPEHELSDVMEMAICQACDNEMK